MVPKNKEQRIISAEKHYKEMNEKYLEQILESIDSTKTYQDTKITSHEQKYKTTFEVEDKDTVSSLITHKNEGIVCLLNFASFRHPGGGFMTGSFAQEECLCHESNLYNILKPFENTFYKDNLNHLNKNLYSNRALYSPDVIFEKNIDGENILAKANVITSAAPNKFAAKTNYKITNKENYDVLEDRIQFIFQIAAENHAEILILGAWGCGVFEQDPYEVARLFRYYLNSTFKNVFKKVYFAVPKSTRNSNFEAFRSYFK